MALNDLNIRISYKSKGKDDIVSDFLIPAIKESVLYRRSVGFFSSSVFEILGEGLDSLRKNNGRIQIICSPELSEKDLQGIQVGYAIKNSLVMELFNNDINNMMKSIDDVNLLKLIDFISSGKMNIQIVDVENSVGIYHDKIGLLSDFDGNKVLFVGSPNESANAYSNNYEKVRTAVSWIPGDMPRIIDDEEEFESIWNGKNEYVKRIDCTNVVISHFLKEAEKRGIDVPSSKDKSGIKLRDYQKEAIDNWISNGYRGFFVMATGTGKTWTAIYAALEVTKVEPILLVICAPYKHLVRQWFEDVHKVLPDSPTVLVSSENHGWEEQLMDALLSVKYGKKETVIAISTIKSFNTDRFDRIAQKSVLKRMLIVDEAHRFKNLSESIHANYSYLLGLSATPFSKKQDLNGQMLMDFFGGQVYNLPIEYAIEKKYLVHYNYFPIFVSATPEEEKDFERYTSLMMACFRNGVCIDVEGAAKFKRARLRVLSMAQDKNERIDWILSQIYEDNHFIVYCGDGKLYEENTGEEIRHIQYIKERLSNMGYKVSQFTAEENMKERMQLVTAFNKGMIDAMVAIRCLDEGINIPSINGAMILSSNDDYREFVQRRGRILRTYKDDYTDEEKKMANIYDVVVLPSTNRLMAQIELRRYYEYARLASNKEECMRELDDKLIEYGLSIEDIVDLDDNEGELDE